MKWTQVCYRYDGRFGGFLTCVYESYVHREFPAAFAGPEEERLSLYPEREVAFCREKALRVYRSLADRLSPAGQRLVSLSFLTCLPERERAIYDLIRLGYELGPEVMGRITDDRVNLLNRAVLHLTREAHQYQGFVRFSDYGGLLAGEIRPKNQVLPLLRPHFCGRFSGENFLLYDRTHRQALVHRREPEGWAIVPLEDFQPASPGQEEKEYRALWRAFYNAVAIRDRENPKLRMTHMPRRYWELLTELREEPEEEGAGLIKY